MAHGVVQFHHHDEGAPVEQVDSFASLVTQDGQCTKDIKAKIGKANGLMSGLKTL